MKYLHKNRRHFFILKIDSTAAFDVVNYFFKFINKLL